MEITGEDGSKVQIKPFSNTVFGRGSGCITTDRTVSRRHVLFWLKDSSNGTETEPRACFDVIGKNPIWVRSGKSGKLKAFRRNEKGEVTVGDWFYIGGGQSQQPVRFAVKRINEQEAEKEMMEAGESSEWSSGGELESVDVSSIDPVKGMVFNSVFICSFIEFGIGMDCEICFVKRILLDCVIIYETGLLILCLKFCE